jgi:hemerythrin-like domain-containing protein
MVKPHKKINVQLPDPVDFEWDEGNINKNWQRHKLTLKEKEHDKAITVLEEFKFGLEQHMAWEEAILFSEYDGRIPSADEESPTVDLTFEHQQLRDYLEIVLRKMRENKKDLELEKDEARFAELLAAHNFAEETGLYVKLDEKLCDQDRAEIRQRMKDSALM